MARLYANENFPYQTTLALRGLGHDVLTTQDAGQAGRALADEAVLAFAASEQRIVVTLNRRDFIRLHRNHPDHCGIIVCTADPYLRPVSDAVLEAVDTAGPARRGLQAEGLVAACGLGYDESVSDCWNCSRDVDRNERRAQKRVASYERRSMDMNRPITGYGLVQNRPKRVKGPRGSGPKRG